jgi:hypothetical protein
VTGRRWEAHRWPGVLALLGLGVVYLLLPDRYTVGPSWLVLAVVAALLVPMGVARLRGRHEIARWLALTSVGVVTAAVAASAGYLVVGLTDSVRSAPTLLWDAAAIWVANVVTFALWYWELDGGGPHRRSETRYASTDFVFPQLTLVNAARGDDAGPKWIPNLVDYLFLAFSTSTAFSPTDTPVLSRRAKLLMMAQSIISLVVIAVLAARAVNTLPVGR